MKESDCIDDSDKRLLREYSIQIHGDANALTLKKLINSHKQIRKLRLEVEEERIKYFNDGYEHGKQAGLKNIDASFIEIEKLKEMTMQEIANLIGEEQ
jgi:hypothetical protein